MVVSVLYEADEQPNILLKQVLKSVIFSVESTSFSIRVTLVIEVNRH